MQYNQSFIRGKASGNMVRLAVFIALTLPWLGMSAARAEQAATGWWVNGEGTGAIVIAPCGAALCGRIEWIAPGQPVRDVHNPDPSLRSRPSCGLQMMGGMVPDGSGGWQGGWVYDPTNGKTYKAVMHLAPDGTLRLHGYIGIPLFGRSKTMMRPAAPLTPCVPAASG